MDWGQLAIKAVISGLVIAAASEFARRSPGLGGLVASLPLVSTLALIWLWRDSGDPGRVAALAIASSLYVIASLPAFAVLAILLRRGVEFPWALGGFALSGWAGYWAMQTFGRRFGLPV